MKFCTHCGAEQFKKARFCHECGSPHPYDDEEDDEPEDKPKRHRRRRKADEEAAAAGEYDDYYLDDDEEESREGGIGFGWIFFGGLILLIAILGSCSKS